MTRSDASSVPVTPISPLVASAADWRPDRG